MTKSTVSAILLCILTFFIPVISFAESQGGGDVRIIIPENQHPPAEFSPLLSDESLSGPELCLDATRKGLFDKDIDNFQAKEKEKWKQNALCAQNIVDATVFGQKSEDLRKSIAVIQNHIDSLSLSMREILPLKTLDGVTFFIIPAGDTTNKAYKRADNIALKCVLNNENKPPSTVGSYPVGTSVTDKGSQYVEITDKIKAEVAVIKNKITEMYNAYQAALKKNSGRVTQETVDKLLFLQTTLDGNFFLATPFASSKYHASNGMASSTISLLVALEKGTDSKPVKCTDNDTLAEAQFFLKGALLRSTVTIDEKVFANDCIPAEYLLKKLKGSIAKNLMAFRKKKMDYEKQLNQVDGQLAGFAKAIDQCIMGEPVQFGQVGKHSLNSAPVLEVSSTGSNVPSIKQMTTIAKSGDTVKIYADYLSLTANNIAISTYTGTNGASSGTGTQSGSRNFTSPAYRDTGGWYIKFIVKDLPAGNYNVSIDNDSYGFSEQPKPLKIIANTKQSSSIWDGLRGLFNFN